MDCASNAFELNGAYDLLIMEKLLSIIGYRASLDDLNLALLMVERCIQHRVLALDFNRVILMRKAGLLKGLHCGHSAAHVGLVDIH